MGRNPEEREGRREDVVGKKAWLNSGGQLWVLGPNRTNAMIKGGYRIVRTLTTRRTRIASRDLSLVALRPALCRVADECSPTSGKRRNIIRLSVSACPIDRDADGRPVSDEPDASDRKEQDKDLSLFTGTCLTYAAHAAGWSQARNDRCCHLRRRRTVQLLHRFVAPCNSYLLFFYSFIHQK